MVQPSAAVGVFGHGYTYSGHPVACAVASKMLDIYQRDKIFEHAARVGEYLQQRLRDFEVHPLVGEGALSEHQRVHSTEVGGWY